MYVEYAGIERLHSATLAEIRNSQQNGNGYDDHTATDTDLRDEHGNL